MKKLIWTVSVFAICASAHGQQHGLILEVSSGGIVSPSSPSVTFDVYATVDPSVYAFALSGLFYSYPEAGSSAAYNQLLPISSIPGYPGVFWGETNLINGMLLTSVGQSNFASAPADPSSPIHLMSFDWSTTDFAQRKIEMLVIPGEWSVYDTPSSVNPTTLTTQPSLQSITIHVIPAPATSLAFLGAAGALGMRRRR